MSGHLENIPFQTYMHNMTSVQHQDNIILPVCRRGNKNNPATILIINDRAARGGVPLSEGAIFISKHHGAPFIRQDYVQGGLTVMVPKEITSIGQRIDWLRANGVYDAEDKCLVNCIIIDHDYSQLQWR